MNCGLWRLVGPMELILPRNIQECSHGYQWPINAVFLCINDHSIWSWVPFMVAHFRKFILYCSQHNCLTFVEALSLIFAKHFLVLVIGGKITCFLGTKYQQRRPRQHLPTCLQHLLALLPLPLKDSWTNPSPNMPRYTRVESVKSLMTPLIVNLKVSTSSSRTFMTEPRRWVDWRHTQSHSQCFPHSPDVQI